MHARSLSGDDPVRFHCERASLGLAAAALLVTSAVIADAEPAITSWYGDELRFGQLGNPQPLINIPGEITPAGTLGALRFSLNGGKPRPLSIGPDDLRLSRQGAFNVEIEREELRPGVNSVEITAGFREDAAAAKTVRVYLTPGRTWPLPYAIKWRQAASIHDVAETLDGHWQLTPDGLRTLDPYYDRVIAIGDLSWTDYDVVTSVIFHRMLAERIVASGPPYSNHGHAGLLLRWRGHPDDGRQPRTQWRPAGALAMWRADAGSEGNEWIWHGGESGIIAREGTKRPLELGRRYMIRGRVETLPGPTTRYSIKGWAADEPEPKDWDLVAIDGESDVQSGSLLLVAHHSDVTFGDIDVFPVPRH